MTRNTFQAARVSPDTLRSPPSAATGWASWPSGWLLWGQSDQPATEFRDYLQFKIFWFIIANAVAR